MITPVPLALSSNVNKVNILESHAEKQRSFGSNYNFQSKEVSSIANLLANFQLHDENTPPLRCYDRQEKKEDNVASLKAELEATRRKLAEYESRSKNFPQQRSSFFSPPPKQIASPSETTSVDFTTTDMFPWSEYDSPNSGLPPPPHPSPNDFPVSVPPLSLPSASLPFQPIKPPPNLNPGASINISLS